MMRLPNLPVEQTIPAFERLMVVAEEVGGPVMRFVQYIQRTWIRGSLLRPEDRCVFRTNNDLEGVFSVLFFKLFFLIYVNTTNTNVQICKQMYHLISFIIYFTTLTGWHRRLNTRAAHQNLGMYKLITRKESETVNIQIRLVSENLISKIRRKKYAGIHGGLEKAWDLHEEDDITTTALPRTVSHIAGLGPTTAAMTIIDNVE